MPLPTIETPTYELKLPSSNKKIKYRPFLVKEEKILILALESKNQDEITNAVTDVLKKCILTRGVDVDSLPTFDIEYVFLNIRAKSIGEDIKMTVTCADDGETTVPVTIYVDEIKVIKPKGHTTDVVIDDKMTMRMKYPSLNQFVENNFEFVGDKFASQVREIYYDASSKKNIYGTTTPEEREELSDEGIELMSIPWIEKEN